VSGQSVGGLSRAALLDLLFGALPASVSTYEGWSRWHHHDISALTDDQVRRQRDRIRLRLLLEDDPHEWWRERLVYLDRELGERSKATALPHGGQRGR
jgi:hypothetical protein